MKRRIKIIIVGMCVTTTVTAQFRWGVEAGVNINHAHETTETKAGYNAGVTIDYTFRNNIFLESGLKMSLQSVGDRGYWGIYSTEGYEIKKFYSNYEAFPTYLILPIRAGYSLKISNYLDLNLSAGPTLGWGLFGSAKHKDYSSPGWEYIGETKIKNIFDTADGRELGKFEVGGSFRISTVFKKHYTLSAEYNIMRVTGLHRPFTHMNVFTVNLGYKF